MILLRPRQTSHRLARRKRRRRLINKRPSAVTRRRPGIDRARKLARFAKPRHSDKINRSSAIARRPRRGGRPVGIAFHGAVTVRLNSATKPHRQSNRHRKRRKAHTPYQPAVLALRRASIVRNKQVLGDNFLGVPVEEAHRNRREQSVGHVIETPQLANDDGISDIEVHAQTTAKSLIARHSPRRVIRHPRRGPQIDRLPALED